MRALSVQQPYAWALMHDKDVENRRNKRGPRAALAQFQHRGTIAIHASARYAGTEAYDDVKALTRHDLTHPGAPGADPTWAFGAVVGVADLVAAHSADACWDEETRRFCSPWAQPDAVHLQLENRRPLFRAVECHGALGLWEIRDTDVLAQIRRNLT